MVMRREIIVSPRKGDTVFPSIIFHVTLNETKRISLVSRSENVVFVTGFN